MPPLILASQSPRRRRLITLLGFPALAVAAAVDEESIKHPEPDKNVIETARLKVQAVAVQFPNAIVVGADTTVAIEGKMLGKPADAPEATTMLRRLQGRAHQVFTGTVVLQLSSARAETSACVTDVTMRRYADDEIERYVRSGDPFDKAGAYAIQHPTFRPVARIEGCYTNVVGLPLCRLGATLRRFGLTSDLEVAERTSNYRECKTCLKLIAGEQAY